MQSRARRIGRAGPFWIGLAAGCVAVATAPFVLGHWASDFGWLLGFALVFWVCISAAAMLIFYLGQEGNRRNCWAWLALGATVLYPIAALIATVLQTH